jgi:hypothetical protein
VTYSDQFAHALRAWTGHWEIIGPMKLDYGCRLGVAIRTWSGFRMGWRIHRPRGSAFWYRFQGRQAGKIIRDWTFQKKVLHPKRSYGKP